MLIRSFDVTPSNLANQSRAQFPTIRLKTRKVKFRNKTAKNNYERARALLVGE